MSALMSAFWVIADTVSGMGARTSDVRYFGRYLVISGRGEDVRNRSLMTRNGHRTLENMRSDFAK
jgi:hypothetical protein